MIDFTNCERNRFRAYGGANGNKINIRYQGKSYMLKFPPKPRRGGEMSYPPCTVWPELRLEDVDEGLLRFACYVAVCHTVYGQSFESLTTEHILGLVSQLRPDMVKQLKTAGSGKLPKDIQQRRKGHLLYVPFDLLST